MSLDPVLDAGLALLLLAVAGWTVATRALLASVIGFIGCGVLLGLAWVRLQAPDVALTEIAIGSGVTGVLLLTASTRLGEAAPSTPAAPLPARWPAALLSALVAVALAGVLLTLPDPAPTLAPAVMADLPRTGLGNPVTGVLLAYRALDTFLEAVVLLLSLYGVWSLAPDPAWNERPVPPGRPGTDDALVLLARILPPVGLLLGIHLVWVGATAPGGAFQGGTMLAAMALLAWLAGRAQPPPIGRLWLRFALAAGPVLFLLVGLAGFGLAGAFLAYPQAAAKPLILAIEAALTLSIAATLAMLVAGPPTRDAP
ncbi:conserved membrane protein of unknown function [Rhodovastum atsumiense]|uniref:DUF4040 domain-containing protein n=1 Tax=Rhodovastum atsumiense TaxID=504468 RepID=A0A5M6IJJ4_9PROT|nr:hydrogenase subunit MbhD domain-containing protein [Rhodovastum atsumiense]KAA5608342.1 DUF4040 domain-containing protein [Rhodovastum atsumiense]CAH2602344.1 conserved membrane protein of unknown function [Rhodovastum atsumiense]